MVDGMRLLPQRGLTPAALKVRGSICFGFGTECVLEGGPRIGFPPGAGLKLACVCDVISVATEFMVDVAAVEASMCVTSSVW
jgi:hypothetical protein